MQDNRNKYKTLLAIVLVAFVIAGSIFIFMKISNQETKTADIVDESLLGINEFSEISLALEYKEKGKGKKMVSVLAPLLDDSNDKKKAAATRLLADYYFSTTDVLAQNSSIKSLKVLIADESFDASERARAADFLFTLYENRYHSPVLFESIFTGAPFESLVYEDARPKDTVREATEKMLAIFETSDGNLRIADWYASELLENTDLDAGQREVYREMLEMYMLKGIAVYRNKKIQINDTFDGKDITYRLKLIFYTAVLQSEDPLNTQLFEPALKELRLTIASSSSKEVKKYKALTHFYNAALLDLVFGESRQSDIVVSLNKALKLIKKNKKNGKFIRRYVKSFQERSQEEMFYMDRFFTQLLQYSPEFKKHLEEEGMELK